MDLANKSHRSYNLIVIRQSETKYKTGAWWEGTKRQAKGKTIFTSNALRTPPKSYISDSFLKKNPRYNLRWYKCYSDHVNAYKLLQLRWKHNINRESSSVHAVCIHETDWVRARDRQSVYAWKIHSASFQHFQTISHSPSEISQWNSNELYMEFCGSIFNQT